MSLLAIASPASADLYIFHLNGIHSIDFEPVPSSKQVDLTGSQLYLMRSSISPCTEVWLPTGQEYTLIATTGGIVGRFANVPTSGDIELFRDSYDLCGLEPGMHIEYHVSGAIQTVTATVINGSSIPVSEIVVAAKPEQVVTNQPIKLRATVVTSSGEPSGSVSFFHNGIVAPGCTTRPLTLVDSVYEATCETWLTPKHPMTNGPNSPAPLEVFFTPSSPETTLDSSEGTFALKVLAAPTLTTLHASNNTPSVGESIVYTATVTPLYPGPAMPSGRVEFIDGDTLVPSCENQLLTTRSPSSFATCELSYSTSGVHDISATYVADAAFAEPYLFEGSSTTSPLTMTIHERISEGQPHASDGDAEQAFGSVSGVTQLLPALSTSLSLQSNTVAIRGHTAMLRVGCVGTQRCTGKLTLTTHSGLRLATSAFAIAPGTTTILRGRLTAAGRRWLGRKRRGTASATLTTSLPGSRPTPVRISTPRST